MQAADMRQNASIPRVSASRIPARSLLTREQALSVGGAEAAWDEGTPSRLERIVIEGALLERLRVVAMELFKAVGNALQDEHESAKDCIRRAGAVLHADPIFTKFDSETQSLNYRRPKPIRGGLAPWQIRRVATHIEANLDTAIRIKELAALIKLSSFHFCRAFRDSFGDSPHAYVMRRRVERAQGLMLTTKAPLGQIAAECGLADQAHFNKLFRKFVGESPGVWRRARTTAPD